MATIEMSDLEPPGIHITGSPGMPLETVMATFDVLQECRRQVEVEGYDAAHDDAHDGGELAQAAACYAINAGGILLGTEVEPFEVHEEPINTWWPWDVLHWKPKTPRRDLVRAAALIVAEIARIDRAAAESTPFRISPHRRGSCERPRAD